MPRRPRARRGAEGSVRFAEASGSFPSWTALAGGKLGPEQAAVAGRLDADRAAVRLDDLAAQREAQAGARDPARGRVAAEEPREDAALVLRRDADALVLHGDLNEPVLPARRDRHVAAV